MRSSISSSEADPDAWRRFARLAAGLAAGIAAALYLFIVLVDPWGELPFSVPFARWPVDGNARFAFPMLARQTRFDSAVFGTSTSRLLRPAVLNQALDTHFVNLAMNSATAYEQTRMLDLFLRHHPKPRAIVIGLDTAWCTIGEDQPRFTDRPFPEWMYGEPFWRGYAESFSIDALEKAGQAFAEFAGLKPQVYGADGFTSFVPDDSRYDRARVAMHLRKAEAELPPAGTDDSSTAHAPMPALDLLRGALETIPQGTNTLLYFVPYNHVLRPANGPFRAQFDECKRRVAALAAGRADTVVVDFMRASPITDDDDNYWDEMHTRLSIGDRVARDLGAALRGERSPDYAVLEAPARE
jgi:hypothetical protein